jgi:hypothetical protein
MGRAARSQRLRRQADHRTARRWRRVEYVVGGLFLAVAVLIVVVGTMFCVEAGLHPWWTRLASTGGGR